MASSSQNPVVLILVSPAENKLFKVDVLVQNMPKNFLGISFDLLISGKNFQINKYEAGDIFENPKNVLVLAAKKTSNDILSDRLVFGLSLNSDGIAAHYDLEDGIIATFYLDVPSIINNQLKLNFANPVLSVYENGRKDLQNVVWKNDTVNFENSTSSSQERILKNVSIEKSLRGGNISQVLIDQNAQNLDEMQENDGTTQFIVANDENSSQELQSIEIKDLSTNVFGFTDPLTAVYITLAISLVLLLTIGISLSFWKKKPVKEEKSLT